ncbi:hypothetical protein GCM10009789_03710 [Kribbella sancticallisti]|uniref:Uncharacterized protein n=2 Tax=Kribbella sancticallisti TaxID=460087 RepID=A0ABN2C727_9ACTN
MVVASSWSLETLILLLICAVLTGGVVAMVALDPDDSSRLPRDKRRIVATSAVLSGAGTVAFIGLGTLLGAPTAVLLLTITAGGSPWAISHGVRWLRQRGHLPESEPQPARPDPGERSPESAPPPAEADPLAQPRVAPAALSDDALCLAWRASYSALQRADSPAQRLSIIEERRAYLDEIERRNAQGMAAWLASGARAAGDPSRFVLGDGAAGRARIDWDGLLHDTDQ